MKLGLKIWSTNDYYIKEAIDLFSKGIFDYIELFTVQNSEHFIERWSELNIPYILHAPHSLAGINPAQKKLEAYNLKNIETLEKFRKALNPKYIIFHPGLDGEINETIRQFLILKKEFPEIHKISLIENKPVKGINGEKCIGTNPEEIKSLMNKTEMNFCLDIGHAFCAANSLKIDIWEFFEEMLQLKPSMFHLSDGTNNSELDEHRNYRNGNFDLKKILSFLPKNSIISIETEKTSNKKLKTFTDDAIFLRSLSS